MTSRRRQSATGAVNVSGTLSIAGLLVLTLAAATAQAQIFRCERDAKVTYSDRPCEGDAATRQIPQQPPGARGALDLRLSHRYYDVRGLDEYALAQSLRANGPQGFHGLARWNVGYEFTPARDADACRIASVRMTVSGEILMPRWVDEAAAPPDLQRRWRDRYAALLRHEEGHIQHGRELALLVKERLMGLGVVPCDNLKALAQREFERLYENLKTRDREYDARTDHGRNQGL